MKIIEQSHEFIREPDALKLIELAGRTCYKSENKITKDSAKRFVQMITKAGHYSVLEHASAAYIVSAGNMIYLQTFTFSKYLRFSTGNRNIVSGNFRAWLEFFNREEKRLPVGICAILIDLCNKYPEIFPLIEKLPFDANPITEDQMTSEEKLIHATRTCRFITNRGVTHEMVRHRPWAYSQESTRYVNYKGGIEFILPVWIDKDILGEYGVSLEEDFKNRKHKLFNRILERIWLWSMLQNEKSYQNLIYYNWRPEQARGVLPNDLKTEIVCTATLSEWKHMLGLRTSKAAHPQIRALMKPVLAELQEELPEIFKEDTNGTN